MTGWRRAACVLTAVAGGGCLDASVAGPGPDDDVRITYVGPAIADSVGAAVPGVRFFVSEAGSEDRPLTGLLAFFAARGEGCGVALDPSERTDDDGFVETSWQMGDLVGECELRVRVVNASGVLLAFADVSGEVVHGQAETLLWIDEGASVSGTGSLGITGPEGDAVDRLANEVPWRFRVLSGPVRAVGGDPGSAGARTLVALGAAGAGQVAVETRWGDARLLDLCVLDRGVGAPEIRLHWTPEGGSPPACGA